MSETLNVITALLSKEFIVNCMLISNAAVLIYDTTILFSDEVTYIWKSPWSLGKCFYIGARYFAFADVFLNLRLSFDSRLTPEGCLATFKGIPWAFIIGSIVTDAIMIARTFAIYERSYKILAYLICFRFAMMIPMMKLVADWNKEMQYIVSPAPTLAPCLAMGNNHVKVWLCYLFEAMFDSMQILSC